MPSMGFSQSASPKVVHRIQGNGENSAKKKDTNPYWEKVNSSKIPTFLAQFFETDDPSTPSTEDISCLFEVLAEIHGPDIIQQINYVMDSIIRTLTSSVKLDLFQNACKNLVSGIVKYSIHPLIADEKKGEVIYSLYKPLSKYILSVQEDLSYGSALCIEALIDSANWKFASDEIVNDVCLKVAVALEEKSTQTNAHMRLTAALAKHNSLTIEPYARSLIRSGLQILNAGVEEDNSEKQLSAIKMVSSIMKCVHPRSVFTELETVIKEMEKCSSDLIQFVRGAAFEAMEIATGIIREKRSRHEDSSLIVDSSFSRRYNSGPRVPASPGSHYSYSSFGCDFPDESLVSKENLPCKFDHSGNSVKRRLWKEEVSGSLTNGSPSYVGFSGNGLKIGSKPSYDGEGNNNEFDDADFSEGMHTTRGHRINAYVTPSSEMQSQLDIDDVEFFRTQSEFTRSIQDKTPVVPEKNLRRIRKSSSNQVDGGLTGKWYENRNPEIRANKNYETEERDMGSVSVRDVTANVENLVFNGADSKCKARIELQNAKQKASMKVGLSLVFGLSIVVLTVVVFYLWIDNQAGLHFFPT